MMRIVTLAGIVLALSGAWARDNDTIPLMKKSTAKSGGNLEVPLTLPKNGNVAKGPGAVGGDADSATPGGDPRPYVASIETFGSPRINDVALKAFLGKELDAWIAQGIKGAPEAMELENRLLAKVKEKWGFAYADWSIMEYFEPGDLPVHITLDVVDRVDVPKRMPFLPLPTAEYADPDGVLKAWMEYEEVALDLLEANEIEPEAENCPAFHCPFGHKHPKLKKYEKIFVEGAKKHQAALVAIQAKDKRAEYRAAASYVLAYLQDGKQVISYMIDRIKDPDAMVRNNALRVLGDIADFHPDLVIPIGGVIEALHFPRVSDRSKAIYVVYLTALNSESARDTVLKNAVPDLLQMMQSSQPDHKELAQAILRKVSGKDYAAADVQAWTNWYNRLPKTRVPSAK